MAVSCLMKAGQAGGSQVELPNEQLSAVTRLLQVIVAFEVC